MDSTQNIISFCSGYGGLELGLQRVSPNFRTVCYVEIEAFAAANLVAKIEEGKLDAAPIWTDIKTFPAESFSGKIHGIIGGYPCQPFSNAGQRKGTKDPRHLWPYIEEHIRTIRPLWCFFENVSGHLSLGFKEVQQSLRDLGYSVEAGLFTAAEVGAPHKRERLFILAYNKQFRQLQCESTLRHRQGVFKGGSAGQEELAYSERFGRRRWDNGELRGQGRTLQAEGPSELANTERSNEQGCNLRQGQVQSGRGGSQLADSNGSGCEKQCWSESIRQELTTHECSSTRWPARPGQEQYEWEEPRTVESGMGRDVDGTASRVDELRLLGNGAFPEATELAFRTLAKGKI